MAAPPFRQPELKRPRQTVKTSHPDLRTVPNPTSKAAAWLKKTANGDKTVNLTILESFVYFELWRRFQDSEPLMTKLLESDLWLLSNPEHGDTIVTVTGGAERIPRSVERPTVGADERTPASQITLSAQTASFIVGLLSDVGR